MINTSMGWLCWGEMWHILGSSERNSSMATPGALCHGGPPGLGLDEGKAEPTTQWCNSKNPQSLHLSAAAPSLPRGTPRTLIADQVLRGGYGVNYPNCLMKNTACFLQNKGHKMYHHH